MATRVTDGARQERPSFHVSRGSRSRALLSLNLKKKRDYSQSTYKEEPLSLFWKTDGDYGIRMEKT